MSQITGVSTFTLDAVGSRDLIQIPGAFGACHKISIWETEATSEYTLGAVADAGVIGVTFPMGFVKIFRRSLAQNPFQPGDILGYGSVPSGSVTFCILGEEEVI